MRRFPATILLTAIALAPAGHAQRTVPPGLAKRDAKTVSSIPLGFATSRIQIAYDARATGFSKPTLVRSLAARPDASASLASALEADFQVWLSSDGVDLDLKSTSPAKNHGTDLALFMKRKTYKFAAFSVTNARHPFGIVLKGDQPWLVRKSNLLVDWASYSSKNRRTNLFLDATRAAIVDFGTARSTGAACKPSGFSHHSTGLEEGQVFRSFCYTRSPGDLVFTWLSPKRVAIDIGGGCRIQADFGAPGAIVFPTPFRTAASSGYAWFDWGKIPAGFRGTKLYSQAVKFGRETGWSNGLENIFGKARLEYIANRRTGFGTPTRAFDPDKDALTTFNRNADIPVLELR